MLSRLARPFALLALLGATTWAAPQAELKVGDPAPALSIAKWVKGAPVASLEKGQVYVIEFWATWCGPCIAGMPHLSDVQEHWRDKGVTVISVTSEDRNNTLQAVEDMVAAKGSVMDYTVAWDEGRKTNQAWMNAANQNGIPCSFIVDAEGIITFIGHPMWLDIPLAAMAAGTWDHKTGAATIAEAEKGMKKFYALLNDDPAKALVALKEFEQAYPGAASQFIDLKLQLCLHLEHFDDAFALCGKLVDKAIANQDAGRLNELAWIIVDPRANYAKRDIPLARRAARKAVELTKGEDPNILDTLARAHFLAGDVQEAIMTQKKATALDPANEGLAKTLTEYEEAAKS